MIGTGYVGLVTGACLAEFRTCGHVRRQGPGQDRRASGRQDADLRAGPGGSRRPQCPRERLSFTTDLAPAVRETAVVFVAVGTPSRRGDGHADLSYVYGAAREIAAAADGFPVVVTKSTVPVGTGDEVERIIRETRSEADIAVVSNPEFLREGAAIEDFKRPDRIVIGTEDERARAVMAEVYRPLYRQPGAAAVHRTAHLGVDQIRGQRLPSHQDHPSSTRSPICARRPAPMCRRWRAHRPRQAHRLEIPACRPRLWRLVLFPRTPWR